MKYTRFLANLTAVGLVVAYAILPPLRTQAATLSNRSDTISSSALNTPANHTIRFTTPSTIPAEGSIYILFPATFIVPTYDHQDIDVLVNSSQKQLAHTAGTGPASPWGITITPGPGGGVTILLNDTDSIAAGSTIEIRIGTNSVFQAAGDEDILNPSIVGSYTITVATRAADTTTIDAGTIPIAITQPVGISAEVDTGTVAAAPVFSPPSGTFTNQVTVSITTTTPGATIYYTLDGTTPTTSSVMYTAPLLLTSSTNIRAFAAKTGFTSSSVSSATYAITTTPGAVIPPQGPVTITPHGISSVSAGCGARATLDLYFPTSTFPKGSTLTVNCLSWNNFPIKTGAENLYALSDVLFGITAQDSLHRPIITPQYPLYAVLRYQDPESDYPTDARKLAFFGPEQRWNLTPIQQIGKKIAQFETILTTIGDIAIVYSAKPNYSCNKIRADINCDGKVNVVDLSILMSYWHTNQSAGRADINGDSTVNLIDLTILFYWWSA